VIQGINNDTAFCGIYNRATNNYGSFSIGLGDQPNFTCSSPTGSWNSQLTQVPWEDGNVSVNVKYTPIVGGAFIDLGTIQITSVFYSFASHSAETLTTKEDVYITDQTKGIIMKAPNGNCYRFTANNSGGLISAQIACP
jgi:hypothetical protein